MSELDSIITEVYDQLTSGEVTSGEFTPPANKYPNTCRECNAKKCTCPTSTEYTRSINKYAYLKDLETNPQKKLDAKMVEHREFLSEITPKLVNDMISYYLDEFYKFDLYCKSNDPFHNTMYRYYVKPYYISTAKREALCTRQNLCYQPESEIDSDYMFNEYYQTLTTSCGCNCTCETVKNVCFPDNKKIPTIFVQERFLINLCEYVITFNFNQFTTDEFNDLVTYLEDIKTKKFKIYARNWNVLQIMSGLGGFRYTT